MTIVRKARNIEATGDTWMSLYQVAARLGESRLAILTRVVKGDLRAKHEAGRTILLREDVERVASEKAS